MRIKNVVSMIVSVVLLGAGVTLIALFFLPLDSQNAATNSEDPTDFNVPEIGAEQEKVGANDPPSAETTAGGPKDKTLELTIPGMARIEDDPVPYTTGDDEQRLKENAAIHLKGTGFPWQEEANVYLAGHRLGYPTTDSFLAFYDLNKLKKGDKAYLTDANGKKYTYEVFKEFIVDPTDVYVTKPIEGKNVLTLQTCTLPDYSQRLIVQAELVEESGGQVRKGDRVRG